MTEDARFEDGDERPLRLRALDAEDLRVISAMVQDAVLPASELAYDRRRRRFAMLVNRFRWEHADRAQPERVRAVLAFEDVMRVSSQGFDRTDKDLVLSILAIEATPQEDGAARIEIILAGDGAIALEVEAIEASLTDVTRPYLAPSRARPRHPE